VHDVDSVYQIDLIQLILSIRIDHKRVSVKEKRFVLQIKKPGGGGGGAQCPIWCVHEPKKKGCAQRTCAEHG
jgi:hypothetical protein